MAGASLGTASLIAASLPDADSFDDATAVMREIREGRESIEKAAAALR